MALPLLGNAEGGRGRHQSVTSTLLSLRSKTDLCSLNGHHAVFSRRNIKDLWLYFIDWLLTVDWLHVESKLINDGGGAAHSGSKLLRLLSSVASCDVRHVITLDKCAGIVRTVHTQLSVLLLAQCVCGTSTLNRGSGGGGAGP
jgi:hypothetical protein